MTRIIKLALAFALVGTIGTLSGRVSGDTRTVSPTREALEDIRLALQRLTTALQETRTLRAKEREHIEALTKSVQDLYSAARAAANTERLGEDVKKIAEDLTSMAKDLKEVGTKTDSDELKIVLNTVKTNVDKLKLSVDSLTAKIKEDEQKAKLQLLPKDRVPFNGILLKISEQERTAKMVFNFTVANGEHTIGATVQAPLDKDTRQAPLLNRRTQALPFRVGASYSYNSIQALSRMIARGKGAKAVGEVCSAYIRDTNGSADDCNHRCSSEGAFKTWLDAKASTDQKEAVECWCAPGAGTCKHLQTGVEGAEARGVPGFVNFALGAEVEYGFDRQDVYEDTLESDTGITTQSVDAKATFTLFPTTWFALPIKAGAKIQDGLETVKTERCTPRDPGGAAVTGQSCEDVLFVTKNPGWGATFAGEVGFVFLAQIPTVKDIGLGADLRSKVSSLGRGGIFTESATIFITPTSKPVLTRFGVGVDFNVGLVDDPSDDYDAGEIWPTPFLLFGGGL